MLLYHGSLDMAIRLPYLSGLSCSKEKLKILINSATLSTNMQKIGGKNKVKNYSASTSNRPTIGLALGSGGARGLAHIGIIKVLEAHNIPIDMIAGSSIGAVIGGMYASGLEIETIEQLALDTDWRKLFFLVDPHLKQGLIGGDKIKSFIKKNIKGKSFDQCLIPFSAIATNLKNGEIVVLNKGDLAQAIRASMSIPLAFKPVKMSGQLLADGFLSNPVPVDSVRKMGADIVIAVNLDKPYFDKKQKPSLYNITNNSLDILRYQLSRANAEKADLAIEIDLGKSAWFEFNNGAKKIQSGEQAMKAVLSKLRKIIAKKQKI